MSLSSVYMHTLSYIETLKLKHNLYILLPFRDCRVIKQVNKHIKYNIIENTHTKIYQSEARLGSYKHRE